MTSVIDLSLNSNEIGVPIFSAMTTNTIPSSAGLSKKVTVKQMLLFCLMLAFGVTVQAQKLHGGFGNFMIGPAYNFSSSLQNYFEKPDLLGSDIKINKSVLYIGGAGYSLRRNGFIIGGSGYGYSINTSAQNGKLTLHTGAGFVNFGYCLLNDHSWLAFPYAGVGCMSSELTVTNTSTDASIIIDGKKLAPRSSDRYNTGGLVFEVGFAMKHFCVEFETNNPAIHPVLMLGADLGASLMPSFSKWSGVDSNINKLNTPFTATPYLRFTMGIGVFKENK